MEHKNYSLTGSNTSRTNLYSTSATILSRAAKQRLKWMEHFAKYRSARLTCRHFGISPDTFYLWKNRFLPDNLTTLEDNPKTRRPHQTRVSKHKIAQLDAIIDIKKTHPRLGKIRIAKMIQNTGYEISSSTVGRLLRNEISKKQ